MPRTVRALLLGACLFAVGALTAAPAGAAAPDAWAACPGPFPAGTAHCHAEVVAASPLAGVGAPDGYAPADLWSAYGIALAGDGLPAGGANATVALVGAYDAATAEADLAAYRTQFGLPPCTGANGCLRRVNQRGDAAPLPAANASWGQELTLDLEMVSAICPRCRLLLVEADSNYLSDLAAAVSTAGALGATQISNSYGAPEYASETVTEPAFDQPGVDITASSGDGGYGTEFPAASRYVTAVGGTRLAPAANARGWTETAWSGAGSGCSKYIPKPAWQSDAGCARRALADVSAVADPSTGVATYTGGGWVVFGGTSVAAPIVAAVDALAGGRAPGTQRGRFPYDHPGAFHDVTSGSNGSCGGSYLCTGGAGYDGPTGIGTPAGAADLLAPAAPVITAPAGGTAGSARDVTVTGTAEPGAQITVLDGDAAAGTGAADAAGAWSVALSGLADGAHVLRATATDAAGNVSARSAAVALGVDATPPAAPVLTAPADGAALAGGAVPVQGSAEPGALVRVRVDGTPVAQASATGAGAWSATITGLADGPHVLTATATDAAGNVSAPSAEVSVTVDGTPPDTTIVDGPAGDGQAADALVVFSSDDPAATFACRLDDAAWAPCASPLALAGLADGAHTFAVRARDAAGNEDPTPATRTWTVGAAAGPKVTPPSSEPPTDAPKATPSAPAAPAQAVLPDVHASGPPAARSLAGCALAAAPGAGRVARDRRARGLRLVCTRPARLTLTARVRIAGAWRPVRLAPRSVVLGAAGGVALRLRLGPRTAAALRLAGRGRLTVVVRDASGSGRAVLARTLRG